MNLYQNYGDADFFEYGCLVDMDQKELDSGVVKMFVCRPYSDNPEKFQFSYIVVDTNDTWIDKDAVSKFADVPPDDMVLFAIACADYYDWANFSAGYGILDFNGNPEKDWRDMSRDDICDILKANGLGKYARGDETEGGAA